MSDKLAEYHKQKLLAEQLLQAAKDETITELIKGLQATGKVIDQLKQLAPEYRVTELSDWKEFAVKLDISAGRTPAKGRAGRTVMRKSKTGFTLSEAKAKEYVDFIGKGEKSAADFKKHFKTANPSNALTYLKKNGKIKVARQDGLKKYWKRA